MSHKNRWPCEEVNFFVTQKLCKKNIYIHVNLHKLLRNRHVLILKQGSTRVKAAPPFGSLYMYIAYLRSRFNFLNIHLETSMASVMFWYKLKIHRYDTDVSLGEIVITMCVVSYIFENDNKIKINHKKKATFINFWGFKLHVFFSWGTARTLTK